MKAFFSILRLEGALLLRRPVFQMAVIITLILSLISTLVNVNFVYGQPLGAIASPKEMWIGLKAIGGNDLAGLYYLILLPMIASLPHAAGYLSDRRRGLLPILWTHVPKRTYFNANAVLAFGSGFFVSILLPLIDFLSCLCLSPQTMLTQVTALPIAVGGPDYFESYAVYDLFLRQPMLYILLFIGICGIAGGIFALIGYIFSLYLHSRLIIFSIVFPTALWFVSGVYFASIRQRGWNLGQYVYPLSFSGMNLQTGMIVIGIYLLLCLAVLTERKRNTVGVL